MKKIISLMILVLFLTGCGITGKVVEELEEHSTQMSKDQGNLAKAISKKDISYCYSMQTQELRESCFFVMANELNEPAVCDNLLGRSLKESCKSQIE